MKVVETKPKKERTEQERLKAISKEFGQWIADPAHIQFQSYRPLSDRILIRLFIYMEDMDKKAIKLYMDMHSDKTYQEEFNMELYAVGKVLAVGNGVSDWYKGLVPGDLIVVPDYITGVQLNPDWKKYQEDLTDSPRLKGQIPEPSMITGMIKQWEEYRFKADKLSKETTKEDSVTFLLPQRYILASYE